MGVGESWGEMRGETREWPPPTLSRLYSTMILLMRAGAEEADPSKRRIPLTGLVIIGAPDRT